MIRAPLPVNAFDAGRGYLSIGRPNLNYVTDRRPTLTPQTRSENETTPLDEHNIVYNEDEMLRHCVLPPGCFTSCLA